MRKSNKPRRQAKLKAAHEQTTEREVGSAKPGIAASTQWIIAGALFVVVIAGWLWLTQFRSEVHIVSVDMPTLSQRAQAGQLAFQENCAQCHGRNAGGTDVGPPLIHKIYEPSHHGDMAFRLAAQQGVRQHHWNFGNMPSRPDVSDRDIEAIIIFVREVQRANDIF